MHSQHAYNKNLPCILLYKSLWKGGAGPDKRAKCEENFSRVWAFTETIEYRGNVPKFI